MEKMPELCLGIIQTQHVLALTEAIPQLVGFSREADEALEELQEASFSLISTVLYAYAEAPAKKGLKNTLGMWLQGDFLSQVLQSVEKFIKTTEQYKCERPSAEMACDCLAKLCEEFPEARGQMFQSGMMSVVTIYGNYISSKSSVSLAKYHCIRALKVCL